MLESGASSLMLWHLASKMEVGSLAYLLTVSVLLMSGNTEATKGPSPDICLVRTLADIAASRGDLCYQHLLEDNCTPRVLQVAGSDLRKAFILCSKGSCIYCASLFYVESSPFSRITREMFNHLSILFPDICHLAVESSGLWPSELSEHGVRSLPTLFLHNKTSRFQFHGSRHLETLSQFYEGKTGLMRIPLSFFLGEASSTLPRREAGSQENSWTNRFTAWMWNDFYLAFAIFFVMLRCFLYVQPKLAAAFKHYWLLKGMSSRALVGWPTHGAAEQRKRKALVARRINGKFLRKDKTESGTGVLSVSSWPSSSLAVALGECSSRSVTTEDASKKASGA